MTNWHHDNPIMTTEQPISLPELIAELTLNGSQDCRLHNSGRPQLVNDGRDMPALKREMGA